MWHWKLFRPQRNIYCRFPSVFKSRRWRVSASFIWALYVLARQSGLQFSKELLIQWNMVKVMVVIVMSNFSVISQPTTNRAMVRVFFSHSTLRLMSPLLWKPFARPAANDLFILCNILYYIYSYTWLCDILKEKIASGIVFWKEGAFLFFAFTVNVFVLVSFYLSITFSTILYNVYFFHWIF